MIRALAHLANHQFSDQVDLANVKAALKDRRTVLWLDVEDPTPAELELLREQFGFHELAIEDASRPHQRPKLEEYDDFYFMVFYSMELTASIELTTPDGRPAVGGLYFKEVDFFAGTDYLVAVHREPIREIPEGLRRWERNHDVIGHGVGALLYSLLDSMVDNYFGVADRLAEEASGVQEQVFRASDGGTVQSIFALKKHLLAMRRVLGPERDALTILLRQDIPLLDRKTVIYLRDVYDHLVRITDTVDLQSDLLSSGLDVYLSNVSNRLNQIVKTLTSVTIILMTMALIAGIYGMNFANMPELSWPWGYAWALGLMAFSGVGLFLFLRSKGWL